MTTNHPLAKAAPAPIGWTVSIGVGCGVALSLVMAAEILPSDVAFATLTTATAAAAGAALVLTHKHLFDIRRLALPALALMSYLVLIAVPAIFVFLDEAGSGRFRYLLAVHSALFTIPLGVVLTEFVLGSSDRTAKPGVAIAQLGAIFAAVGPVVRARGCDCGAARLSGWLHTSHAGAVIERGLAGDGRSSGGIRQPASRCCEPVFVLLEQDSDPARPDDTGGGGLPGGQKARWLLRAVAVSCVAVFHGTFTLEKSFQHDPVHHRSAPSSI